MRAETTRRAPTFKTIGVEGKAAPPTEPRVNTEIQRPTRAAELEPKHALVAIQCRPIPQEHATGCKSMQAPYPRNMPLVASQCYTSGAPPGCSGETCSLSEETKAPTATATRASCHEARHNRRSLPHPSRRVSSGGALLSSDELSLGLLLSSLLSCEGEQFYPEKGCSDSQWNTFRPPTCGFEGTHTHTHTHTHRLAFGSAQNGRTHAPCPPIRI